uniref:Uncharacterized protein n=1 Tax=Medicago truncatula TaxID=3880 RepID=A2Q1R3_MEDTR|nr:hypothetical protein MtrDRAFT_AC149032g31v2 [Medicago truncatula]
MLEVFCINNRGPLLPKGNDLLATVSAVCLDTLPSEWRLDFFRDRCGFPNYRFP